MSKPFKEGQLLIEVTTKGFASKSPDESAAREAVSQLKQLAVLGRLSGHFIHQRKWSFWGGRAGTRLTMKQRDSEVAFPIDLPPDVGEYLAGLSINPSQKEHDPQLIGKVGALLGQDIQNQDVSAIRTAAEWAFDSLSSQNETVSFIQLCIALEAILGDEQTANDLTKRLADRCAYLIGNNAKIRADIRDQFEILYDRRSKLVHGRRIRLDPEDRESLHWGSFILERILKKELRFFE